VNYDAAANVDDGSCIATVFGCTDPAAFNFDPLANADNGGCIVSMPVAQTQRLITTTCMQMLMTVLVLMSASEISMEMG